MQLKSYLKPENSIAAGIAVVGAVYALYEVNVGNVAQAHYSDNNHPVLTASKKKAGYQAFILVAGIGLIAKDANILILGFSSIAAMELVYRHAIMADPGTGKMVPPSADTYQPAENVTPMYSQGEVA